MFENMKNRKEKKMKEKRLNELSAMKSAKIDEKYHSESESRRKRREIEEFTRKINDNQKKYLTASEVELPQLIRDTARNKRMLNKREILVQKFELDLEIADHDIQLLEVEMHDVKYGTTNESQKERDKYTEKRRNLMERLDQVIGQVKAADDDFKDLSSSDEERKEMEYARKLRASGLNPSDSDLDSSSKSGSEKDENSKSDNY
jgi:hypothetical protein